MDSRKPQDHRKLIALKREFGLWGLIIEGKYTSRIAVEESSHYAARKNRGAKENFLFRLRRRFGWDQIPFSVWAITYLAHQNNGDLSDRDDRERTEVILGESPSFLTWGIENIAADCRNRLNSKMAWKWPPVVTGRSSFEPDDGRESRT
ncbi:hypothetical protein R3P38DRAFT_2758794 [Favolaschia claudopus]|uniref:Uncharacterized protein n=1 Tax=Favolaschia claudopus TaxID=2862362 RepID=A0AAW0E261_9AGAR